MLVLSLLLGIRNSTDKTVDMRCHHRKIFLYLCNMQNLCTFFLLKHFFSLCPLCVFILNFLLDLWVCCHVVCAWFVQRWFPLLIFCLLGLDYFHNFRIYLHECDLLINSFTFYLSVVPSVRPQGVRKSLFSVQSFIFFQAQFCTAGMAFQKGLTSASLEFHLFPKGTFIQAAINTKVT